MKTVPPTLALVTIALASLGVPAVAQSPSATTPAGRWVTESGNLEVEIAPCGALLCGTVTRVIGNRSMSQPGQQMEAADKRPALGMQILTDLRGGDDGVFFGEIYNRENAKTYSARLSLDGPRQLLVRAYIGLPVFGKTQLWRRAETAAGEAP